MNKLWKKLKVRHSGKNKVKSLVISVVILLEIFALCTVGVYAWVETVSSIKITNATNTTGSISNDTRYTDMLIGGNNNTIDLLDYFEASGDMHLAPASSADGKTFYFPKANINSGFIYRKGNVSDKNTTYLSVSFRLRADTNADFFFADVTNHPISVDNDIRVSVTAYSEGENPEGHYDPATGKLISNTKIYANNASTTAVVNSTSGTTGATAVEKFSDHIKGKSSSARLFAVGANETKIVTINVWLQKKTDSNEDITTNMAATQAINYLGITSSLTPRHVTLLPTPTWDTGAQTYYAWCWTPNSNQKSRLYKLELNSEEEHYTFDYNGTYTKTTFVRAVPGCTVQPGEYDSWPFTLSTNSNDQNNNKYWNQTVDTSIPNDPVDPTYIIETISGGTDSKSTGSWHDPATIKVAACTGQSTWGTVTATSYIGTTISTHVIESTNSTSQKHKDTVHAWPEKAIRLTASVANANYAFVGWYDNPEGVDNGDDKHLLDTGATYTTTAPATPTEKTYYAKFKEVRQLTIYRYLDGAKSGTACGTITINGTISDSGSSVSTTVDKGTSVSFSASAIDGYTCDGIYTTTSGTTLASSPITLDNNTVYYARYTTNSYNVTAHACYSSDGGSSYTADDSTGGTVKAGSATDGATSTDSVKYKSSVTLVAYPEAGYEFAGWYSAASGGTRLSSNTTYSYSLSTTGDKDVYARFIGEDWAIKYGVSGASSWNSEAMTVSGDTVTGSMTLTEGQDFSFQIVKTVGSTNTWYGGTSSYENITSTSFISNKTLSVDGGDIYMKGHAGTYTFTFNRSTKVLNVTVSYSNITITFDYSSASWWGNDNAVISFYDGSGENNMSNVANQTKKTISVSSTRGNSGNVGFNRWNNASHSTFWNNENAGTRGYSTTYKLGSGWQ